MTTPRLSSLNRGFTLIEAVMVIVITGIIASTVGIFIKNAVDSYFYTVRRVGLSDVADTAVQRIVRDIHLALPNSVRNPGNSDDPCIEFIPTKMGGRYRAAVEGTTGHGNSLDFTQVDDSFDMLWLNSNLPAVEQLTVDDVVVVYNDGSTSGNAYTGGNAIQVASVAEPDGTAHTTVVTFVGASAAFPFNRKQFPSESPAYRFHVIPKNEQVVAFGCSNGVLYRYSRTLIAAWALPATCAAMTVGATSAKLAQNLTACSLKYEAPGASTGLSRFGIVSISLEVTESGESVKLYQQIHVDNTP